MKYKLIVHKPKDKDDANDAVGDDVICIYLYMSAHIATDCDLKIGNDIQGVLWLMGRAI